MTIGTIITTKEATEGLDFDLGMGVDLDKVAASLRRAAARVGVRSAALSYAQVPVVLALKGTDCTQSDIGAMLGMAQGDVSKVTATGGLLAYMATGGDEPKVPKSAGNVATAVDNVTQFWGHHWGANPERYAALSPTLTGTVRDLMGDDGEARVTAIRVMAEVFGSASNVYSVIAGTKLHPNDPRNNADPVGDDPEGEPGDNGDPEEGEPASIETLLAQVAAVAKARGLSTTEWLDLCAAAY